MSEDILYTPDEIAQKLKITKSTVYEMIKRGDLDAHRMGKHLRISKNQLEIYLLKAKGYENSYEANLILENEEIFAEINSVKIQVNTSLEGKIKISIRPEDIILSKDLFISSARNIHKGIVSDIIVEGSSAKVILDIGIPIVSLITTKSLNELSIEKGTELYAIFKTMSVKVYK
ncbi:excisionase family DNA-binding protein [Clostridium nigeriense]|uniref:excisionase family DNA-binding protein n=1 Tax=Clostridium nigeriense TaxID=1805470 RepID=UPI000829B274|nr:excisionase family DNA-binding protein [Clostridium nigeriense]